MNVAAPATTRRPDPGTSKRVFDLVVAGLALIALAPLMGVLALLVRWKLGAPILFRQVRPGLYGAPFTILKFRSMREVCGPDGRPLPDEARLTPFGAWLRRTSLDELPELWNVLRGEMSLVGPRPLLMAYLDRYSKEQARRLHVLPGITGLAQVSGRNALTWEERFELDVRYVDQHDLRMDMAILLRTVGTVLRREGIHAEGHATMTEFLGSSAAAAATPDAALDAADAAARTARRFAPWPHYADDEIEAATAVLRSGRVNYWTGDEARSFEREFAEAVGRRHAIAVANGTVALELALHAFGVGTGDEVITSSRTFIASASAAVVRGAVPVIADVDPDSQNVTAATIAACITPRTRAIIVVHLAGWPCEMDEIAALAESRGLVLIEDCAQAVGATYRGRPVGSFGHASAFSFCQDKTITTGGEGGMLALDDEEAWSRAWSYKDHGKSFDAVYRRDHPVGYRWLHESFGTNMRLTEPQAAIGRVQLRKLEGWVATRRRHAARLNEAFERTPGLRLTRPPEHVGHAYYKYYAFVEPERLRAGWDRDRIMTAVQRAGVPCFSGSCSEIYLERAFEGTGWAPAARLPVAQRLGATSLMLLVHPTLGADAIDAACDAVDAVMRVATG